MVTVIIPLSLPSAHKAAMAAAIVRAGFQWAIV